MSHSRRPSTWGIAWACLLAVSSLWLAGPVAAATPSATGATGDYYLVDNRASPGVRCVYEAVDYPSALERIRVRPPVAYARNRRDGRLDRQVIGWRYLIQNSADGNSWTTVARSRVQRAIATDHTPADFSVRTWRARAVSYQVRVVLRLLWFRDDRVVGRATVVPRYYAYRPIGRVYTSGCMS